jgi:serine/threonine-protein kinase
LHRRDIIHGDIKPSNIMLNASGSVKIIDVGSAFKSGSPPTWHHFTPAYAAPEFLRDGAMTRQSDLASVGYMLIELLSGKPIFDDVCDPDASTRKIGKSMRTQLYDAKMSLPDRITQILPSRILGSHNLVDLCRGLINPDLNRRFRSAEECILHHQGTHEFSTTLAAAGLGVCKHHEISQLLANAKEAMRLLEESDCQSK